MNRLVALEKIDPNPFQPRTSEDPEHVNRLAESILRDGLLQVPVGREAAYGVGRFQLAFGHSRLAAYRKLNSEVGAEYGYLTVSVRGLTDQQMFEMAITENVTRKNLTPIEEARAMLHYRDDFGKSSVEIGELFGISDSTVRNKMRLLELPETVQENLEAGQIGEANARRLLTLQKVLPEKVDKVAQEIIAQDMNPKAAEQHIAYELNTDKSCKLMWEKWKDRKPRGGEGLWPLDWRPAKSDLVCTACENHIRIDGAHYCCDIGCWKQKKNEWMQIELAQVQADLNIPVYNRAEDGKEFIERDWSTSQQFDNWVTEHDADLRLRIKYNDYRPHQYTNSNCVEIISVNADALAKSQKAALSSDSESWEERHARLEAENKRRDQSVAFMQEVASIHFAFAFKGLGSLGLSALAMLAARRLRIADTTEELELPEFPESLYRQIIALDVMKNYLFDRESLEKGPVVIAARLQEYAEEWGIRLPENWHELALDFADQEVLHE